MEILQNQGVCSIIFDMCSHTKFFVNILGQTYPEQPAKPITSLQDVFYHRDNFRMALNTSTSSSSLEQHPGEKSHNPKEDHKSDSPPPPLYPKQYHAVVEQRRRSGLDRPTAVAVPAGMVLLYQVLRHL